MILHAPPLTDAAAHCPLAGREPRDRRALVPSRDGFGSVWLFANRATPAERAWAAARERFDRTGAAIIDEFIGADAALDLHEAAYRLYVTQLDDFKSRSGDGDEGQHLSLAADDSRLGRLGEWLSRIDALLAYLTRTIPALSTATHRSRPVLTVHPGNRTGCAKHLDSQQKPSAVCSGRVLSLALHLNPGWIEAEHGGGLRLWAPAEEPQTVSPVLDRLVVFRSSSTPTEILPTERDRLALSVWFSDRSR